MSTIEIQTPDGPLVLDDDRFQELHRTTDPLTPLPRVAYAATHVVMREAYGEIPHSPDAPGTSAEIAEHMDWDATMQLRRKIGEKGLGIAEAMDTAQRFSLGWDAAKELIRRTGELQLTAGFCAGAGSDQLPATKEPTKVIAAVSEQIAYIRSHGGVPVILPMPLLCELNLGPDDYVKIYQEIVKEAPEDCPLIIHWLGEMFLPTLDGYFPGDSFQRVMRIDPTKVRGAKISLLDHEMEIRLRRDLLERDQLMFTGDDFHFAGLIAGESSEQRQTNFDGREVALGDFSHALLGVLDAIATPAALALRRLGAGDRAGYDQIMQPCELLGQTIFEAPTRYYKAGLAFLAWVNGLQPNAYLVNHEERCRDTTHLLNVVRNAVDAGAIINATASAQRLEEFLA